MIHHVASSTLWAAWTGEPYLRLHQASEASLMFGLSGSEAVHHEHHDTKRFLAIQDPTARCHGALPWAPERS